MTRNFLQEYRKGNATLTRKVEELKTENERLLNLSSKLSIENYELKKQLEYYKQIAPKNRLIDPMFSFVFNSVLNSMDNKK